MNLCQPMLEFKLVGERVMDLFHFIVLNDSPNFWMLHVFGCLAFVKVNYFVANLGFDNSQC